MSDGHEEREEQEWRRQQEQRRDRPEQYQDQHHDGTDRDLHDQQDQGQPERKES